MITIGLLCYDIFLLHQALYDLQFTLNDVERKLEAMDFNQKSSQVKNEANSQWIGGAIVVTIALVIIVGIFCGGFGSDGAVGLNSLGDQIVELGKNFNSSTEKNMNSLHEFISKSTVKVSNQIAEGDKAILKSLSDMSTQLTRSISNIDVNAILEQSGKPKWK